MIDRWQTPETLPPDAREWFDEIVAELRRQQRLDEVYPLRVQILAQLVAQYQRLTKLLNTDGQILEIRNDKGEVKSVNLSPEFRGQMQLVDKITKAIKELKLDADSTNSPAPESRHEPPRDRLRELLATIAVAGKG